MGAWAAIAQGAGDIGKVAAQGYENKKAAKEARIAYQHRYRWAMKDMRRAGLNPILAAGGSQPVPDSYQPVDVGRIGPDGGELVNTALGVKRATLERKQMEASTSLIEQQEAESKARELQAQSAKDMIDRQWFHDLFTQEKEAGDIPFQRELWRSQAGANSAGALRDFAEANSLSLGPFKAKLPAWLISALQRYDNSAKSYPEKTTGPMGTGGFDYDSR